MLAIMLAHVCASRNDELDDPVRCTRAHWSEFSEWLDAEGLAVRSKSGRSIALTELGYRVAEELLKRYGFGESA